MACSFFLNNLASILNVVMYRVLLRVSERERERDLFAPVRPWFGHMAADSEVACCSVYKASILQACNDLSLYGTTAEVMYMGVSSPNMYVRSTPPVCCFPALGAS